VGGLLLVVLPPVRPVGGLVVGLLSSSLLLAPSLGTAQDAIRVAVTVTDPAGTLESAVNSALGDIPDVSVVTLAQPHDVALRLVALCTNPACGARAVSIVLTTPLPESGDIASPLVRLHEQSVGVWGTDVYERAARSLIEAIDSACFEQLRGEKRVEALLAAGDTATATTLGLETRRLRSESESWSC
jgi:hypothetical protein